MRTALRAPAALAGTACLLALSAAPAVAADAETSPRVVAPGGTVTVYVSCDPVQGSIPGSIEATSQAFAKGTVRLARVTGQEDNDSVAGPAYRGRAKIASAASFTGDGPNAVGRVSEWGVDGLCPGGEQWAATLRVDRDATPADRTGDRRKTDDPDERSSEPKHDPKDDNAERKEHDGRDDGPEPADKDADKEHHGRTGDHEKPVKDEDKHRDKHHDGDQGTEHQRADEEKDKHGDGRQEDRHEGAHQAPGTPSGPVRTGVGGTSDGGGVNVAALAGGSALLVGSVAAAVLWKRRGARVGR
ncbi:hypothetical protein GL263_18715 [Streptomyces durbertensis]|uniref:Uncharacterized protein n=1 Tax=Streptomyces durbertensis TaxID=2448886 RepID=A0ABR6EJR3_9ACTN|nr:hypothetical protein [Streptomyces durbertensis]MBB1245574.1 hypothetical protein [Streptomyces durbertensis]